MIFKERKGTHHHTVRQRVQRLRQAATATHYDAEPADPPPYRRDLRRWKYRHHAYKLTGIDV